MPAKNFFNLLQQDRLIIQVFLLFEQSFSDFVLGSLLLSALYTSADFWTTRHMKAKVTSSGLIMSDLCSQVQESGVAFSSSLPSSTQKQELFWTMWHKVFALRVSW
jgi:hypothetical protein